MLQILLFTIKIIIRRIYAQAVVSELRGPIITLIIIQLFSSHRRNSCYDTQCQQIMQVFQVQRFRGLYTTRSRF